MNSTAKALVIDLDGTLLHAEPEAIPVWGRSGYRYLSKTSARLLSEISLIIPVVIATGRNAMSVQRMVDQLPKVHFSGFVLENGLVARKDLCSGAATIDQWASIARFLPQWERLAGYENCLGLIPPCSIENPETIVKHLLRLTRKKGYLYKERHKLFVYPSLPSKLSGIRPLRLDPFIVLGDELNDLELLDASAYPATLSTAHPEVKHFVRKKNGYCSPFDSHTAAEDLLTWARAIIRETFQIP